MAGWLLSCVPEADDVNGIVVNSIDQLAQAVDNDTSIGVRPISIQRVNGADVRVRLDSSLRILYLLQELLSGSTTKPFVDIAGNLSVR